MVTIFALLLMGMWIEYQECYLTSSNPIAENSPPNAAICVILVLLFISLILYRLRRPLGLVTAELVVIYTALLVAAPLMTQGMWHRMFGLLAGFAHHQDFKSLNSMPDMLWPHGQNLIKNKRFELGEGGLEGFKYLTADNKPPQQVTVTDWNGKLVFPEEETKRLKDIEEKLYQEDNTKKYVKKPIPAITGKQVKVLELKAGDVATARSVLFITLNRKDAKGNDQVVPGEPFLFSMLVRAEGLQSTSSYFVNTRADNNRPISIYTSSAVTTPTFASPGMFQRVGVCPVIIPKNLKDTFTLEIGISGPGRILLYDLQFFNVQAIESAYTGRKVASDTDVKALQDNNEYDCTVSKPKNMFSLDGLSYLVHGFIPLGQWLMPALAWLMLIGALFLGFFGFNVLMRKQWVDNERFTFPMNIFPRQLFGKEEDDNGVLHGIFQNKIMWIGFAITMPLVLLKGVNHYFPSVPAPVWTNLWGVRLDTYFTDPNIKALFQNCQLDLVFSLLAIMLLVETDILFSMWSCFLLFQFLYMFGKMFNFNRFVGYPWEFQQAIGSFIAFAILAIYSGRRHLVKVFQHILGHKTGLDDSQEVVSYRSAVLFIALSVVMIFIWGAWTHMGPWVSLLFFGWMLVCGFTASKIRAEAGMAYGYWMPYMGMLFVSAMGGFVIFGTTGMLVSSLASGFMCVSCFLFIAPVQVEMMELGRFFKVRPRDIGYGLFLGLIGGLFIGGFVLLCWAYGFGSDNLPYSWPYEQYWYFGSFTGGEIGMDRALANGHLVTGENAPLNFITNVNAKGIGIGFLVTFILAALRSLFMWFPIHPLGYVLATSFFGRVLWLTALIAWLGRVIVLRIGGAHSIRKGLVPFCVGMLIACIVSIIFFDIINIVLATHGNANAYSDWP